MGEVRITLSEDAHKKLNILCAIYRKTQDALIEQLIMKARIPGADIDFLVAGESPEVMKSESEVALDLAEPVEADKMVE